MSENTPTGMQGLPPVDKEPHIGVKKLGKEDPKSLCSAKLLSLSDKNIHSVFARQDAASSIDPEVRRQQVKAAAKIISCNKSAGFNADEKEDEDDEEVSEGDSTVSGIDPVHNPTTIDYYDDDDDDDLLRDIAIAEGRYFVNSEHSDANEHSPLANASNVDRFVDSGYFEIQDHDNLDACSDSGSSDGSSVYEYVEIPDDKATFESHAGDNSDSDETESQYDDDTESLELSSVYEYDAFEDSGVPVEQHSESGEYTQAFAESDDGATFSSVQGASSRTSRSPGSKSVKASDEDSDSVSSEEIDSGIYHDSADPPESDISEGDDRLISPSKKRGHDAISNPEEDSDDEPLMKKFKRERAQSKKACDHLSSEKLGNYGRSTAEKTLPVPQNSLGGEAPQAKRRPVGAKCLPGTYEAAPWMYRETVDESQDPDYLASLTQYGPAQRQPSGPTKPSSPATVPAPATTVPAPAPTAPAHTRTIPAVATTASTAPAARGGRPAKRAWTDAEHTAIETVVRAIRTDEARRGVTGKLGLRDEKLWKLVSSTLKSNHAIDRTLAACKYYWARFGRAKSQFDERAVPGGNCNSTSVQHKRA